MRLHFAWQMFGQRFALDLFGRGARRLRDLHRCCAFIGLQVFEAQLKLLDLAIQLL